MFALPPEVLYDIVALLFSEHLDALVAGDRRLASAPPHAAELPPPSGDSVQDCTPPPRGQAHDHDHQHLAQQRQRQPRTIAALLRVGFQVRHVTLKVLADALGLELDGTGIGRLSRNPWAHIQPVRTAYCVAMKTGSAPAPTAPDPDAAAEPAPAPAQHDLEPEPESESESTEAPTYAPTSLLATYSKMAALEQQWQRVLSHLGELRKQEDDCTAFETSVDKLVEQMEEALELPATVPFHILREPMCRRLGGLLILRNHHLSFTTFVKVVELQLLDMNAPDAEPCDFADLLEALQDLRTSQTDLEDSQTEWTELYGPPLDDHAMAIDEMIPILDKLINLSVEDNESYTKCRDLATGVRQRLVVCKEGHLGAVLGKKTAAAATTTTTTQAEPEPEGAS